MTRINQLNFSGDWITNPDPQTEFCILVTNAILCICLLIIKHSLVPAVT